jgi:hypothetical protein
MLLVSCNKIKNEDITVDLVSFETVESIYTGQGDIEPEGVFAILEIKIKNSSSGNLDSELNKYEYVTPSNYSDPVIDDPIVSTFANYLPTLTIQKDTIDIYYIVFDIAGWSEYDKVVFVFNGSEYQIMLDKTTIPHVNAFADITINSVFTSNRIGVEGEDISTTSDTYVIITFTITNLTESTIRGFDIIPRYNCGADYQKYDYIYDTVTIKYENYFDKADLLSNESKTYSVIFEVSEFTDFTDLLIVYVRHEIYTLRFEVLDY